VALFLPQIPLSPVEQLFDASPIRRDDLAAAKGFSAENAQRSPPEYCPAKLLVELLDPLWISRRVKPSGALPNRLRGN